jgi:hypothetical protein
LRRASGYIVSVSMMSASSSPGVSRWRSRAETISSRVEGPPAQPAHPLPDGRRRPAGARLELEILLRVTPRWPAIWAAV